MKIEKDTKKVKLEQATIEKNGYLFIKLNDIVPCNFFKETIETNKLFVYYTVVGNGVWYYASYVLNNVEYEIEIIDAILKDMARNLTEDL